MTVEREVERLRELLADVEYWANCELPTAHTHSAVDERDHIFQQRVNSRSALEIGAVNALPSLLAVYDAAQPLAHLLGEFPRREDWGRDIVAAMVNVNEVCALAVALDRLREEGL